jgi:pyridoxamine 5'-phosphate oxidase
MDLEDKRREYDFGKLSRDILSNDPLLQFQLWMDQALAFDIQDPTAMTVATVDAQGQPWIRMVLLKGFDPEGFVFYTNLGSRKAQEISLNNQVCLHFPWLQMDRQVIVRGSARALAVEDVQAYFSQRPRDSQLAAWASRQSQPLSSRQELEQQFADIQQRFEDADVPLPDFWGGYLVIPSKIEFWQGGENRLHDRFVYDLVDDAWQITRLSP